MGYAKPLVDLSGDVTRDAAYPNPYVTAGVITIEAPLGVPGKPAHTAIVVPKGYRAGGKVDLVAYFHGINAPPIRDYVRARRFKDILDQTGGDCVLAAPTLGDGAEYGKLGQAADAKAWLDAVCKALSDYGPCTVVPAIGNLILSAHSGGGRAMQAVATALAGGGINIPECWGFDCLYGAGNPLAAPEPLRVAEAGHKSAASFDDWERLNDSSAEYRWLMWTKAEVGRRFRAFWGAGGTKTRTANLDLFALRAGLDDRIEVEPSFFERKTVYTPIDAGGRNDRIDVNPRSTIAKDVVTQRVKPEPPPVAAHDLVPQTVLGRCVAQSKNIG